MNLKSLKEEYSRDSVIDSTNIETASLRIPVLHSKWLSYRAEAKTMLLKAEIKLESCRRDRWLYYSGKHDDDVCDYIVEKSEMKYALAGDPDMLKAMATFQHAKDVLAFTEDALKGISQMGFTIKHIIDNRKFENGIV